MTNDSDLLATVAELVRRQTALEALLLKLVPGRPWRYDDETGQWVQAENDSVQPPGEQAE